MNDGSSIPLDALRDGRREFKTGAFSIEKRLEEIQNFDHLAKTTTRFLHEVNGGLFKNSEARLDMETLALSNKTKERETTLVEQMKSDDKDLHESAERQLKNILPIERSEEIRQRIWGYLRKNHGYLLHIIDRLSIPTAPQASVPLSRQKEIMDTIVDSVVNFASRKEGLPTIREPLEYEPVRKIIGEVANRVEALSECKTININAGDPLRIIRQEEERLQGELEIAKFDLNQAMFVQRDWRRETAKKATQGMKIFETPYYQSIFARCDAVRDKQNGIGGKVFYGPPGTGKTEIAIHDAEVRNGFDTRVVSMHYWSSFHSLVYEASVKVAGGADKSLSYQDRMMRGIALFEGMKGEEFLTTVKGMVSKLIEQGKIGKDTTVSEFLKEFTGDVDIGEIENGTSETGEKLRNAVISGLKQYAAGATFGHVMTEEDFWSEVVKGEVLQAIDRGQDRIILDEGEKAGPFAWAGLSRVLSMSPGETLDVAGRKITIPSNLRVDVTVNSLQLDEYIRSRFNEIYVGYPPPKDEMMISSVWLSDKEGNILLSEDEQYRLAGFFTYMLPEIRQLYDQGIIGQPFDLRVTHELCNLLVDPKTQRRTGNSLERALEMILYEQRGFAQFASESSQLLPDIEKNRQRMDKQKKAFDELNHIFARYRQLIETPAPIAGEEEKQLEDEMVKRQTDDLRKLREEILKRGLEATVSSPLAAATLLLPDHIPSERKSDKVNITEERHLNKISLGSAQITKVREHVGAKAAREGAKAEEVVNTTYVTDIGFNLEIADDGKSLRLLSLNRDGNFQELLNVLSPENMELREILDATPDGRFALARAAKYTNYTNTEQKKEEDRLIIIKCWHEETERSGFQNIDTKDISNNADIKLLSGGNGIVVFDKSEHTLDVHLLDTETMTFNKEPFSYNGRVEDMQLSQDRNVMLISGTEETFFIDLQQMILRGPQKPIRPTERLKGKNWHIIGNRMVYNPDTNQTFFISLNPRTIPKEFIQ